MTPQAHLNPDRADAPQMVLQFDCTGTHDPATDTTTVRIHRVCDSFGRLTSETKASMDCVFGYTGKLFDEATGLQNNWRRWYDAATGRRANPACNPTFNVYPSTAGQASSGTRRGSAPAEGKEPSRRTPWSR